MREDVLEGERVHLGGEGRGGVFGQHDRITVLVRGAGTGVIMAVTGYLATVVSANFVVDVSDFISFLLYIVIPWSAINLVDYYFVRRGNYDIQAIFEPNGRYGRVNWRTVAVFLVGIAVEIPFMNASYPQFEGPVASALAGVAEVSVVETRSQIGSGALPVSLLPSAALALRPVGAAKSGAAVEALARTLRGLPIPVIGRIEAGNVVLDLRCLEDEAGFLAQLGELRGLPQ